MYVLGILGSPRIGGNADILLERALKGARGKGADTEKIVINDLEIAPCQQCEKVRDDGTCKIKDGFQPLYRKITKADAVILASPIFFGSLSAQTKTMIDRFQCLWRYRYVLNKPSPWPAKKGAFICVEASERESFIENAKSIVRNFFATVNIEYKEELFVKSVNEKGAILKDPASLEMAFELGKRIAC